MRQTLQPGMDTGPAGDLGNRENSKDWPFAFGSPLSGIGSMTEVMKTAFSFKRVLTAVVALTLLAGWALRTRQSSSQDGLANSPARRIKFESEQTRAAAQGADASVDVSKAAAEDFVSILEGQGAELRRRSLEELGRRYGRLAPAEGWKLLARIPGLADRESFAVALLREWAVSDPRAALGACSGLASGELKTMAYAAALSGWAHQSPVEAAEWSVRHLAGSQRRSAIREVARAWAESDPEAAAKWALGQSTSASGRVAIEEVMRYWAGNDALAGAEWALQQPPGSFQQAALAAVVSEWADLFPEQAAAWVLQHPVASAFAPEVAAQWAKADPAAAADWVRKVPDPALRSELLPVITSTWAASEPREALAWLAGVEGSDERLAAQESLARTWAEDDPIACLDWVQNLPEDALQIRFGEAALATWAIHETDRLARWLQDQKEGPLKDRGLIELAEVWAGEQPQAALDAALSIQDAGFARATALQVYQDWKARDPGAANGWLAGRPDLRMLVDPEP